MSESYTETFRRLVVPELLNQIQMLAYGIADGTETVDWVVEQVWVEARRRGAERLPDRGRGLYHWIERTIIEQVAAIPGDPPWWLAPEFISRRERVTARAAANWWLQGQLG
jgi:hypothetical protein